LRVESGRATVLLVDDREANLMALEAVLESLPVRIVKVLSGREALKFLLKEDCALILLDIQMPGLDGFETAALIRRRERTRTTPIIFVTAIHREEANIIAGYANGAVDYLVKPFDPETLVRKVSFFVEMYEREHRLIEEAALRTRQRDESQRREQAALAEMELERKKLHALLMQAPAAIALLRGPDHVFQLANPRYEELVGRRDLVGRKGREALPDLAMPGIWEVFDRVYATGEPYVGKEFPALLERNTGKLRQGFFNFVAQPTFDSKGAVEGVLIHAVEVTEQVHARQTMEAMAENIPQLAWIADPTGSIYWFNRRWYDYTGTTLAEMEGWGWSKLQHPDHVEAVTAKWKECLAAEEVWEDTFPLRGKDGRYRWFLSRASPIRDELGKVTRWFGTNTDVTAQHDAEQELKEADVRKTEFIGILSHELRNPLAPIRTALALLERIEARNPQGAHARSVIGRQVDHLSRLVDDLLDVTRISHGRIELQIARVNLAALAARAAEDQRAVLSAAKVELHIEVPKNPVWVDADATRIIQVIGNLLQNSAKFTPADGRVDLSVVESKDAAEIHVRDTGVGLDAAMQARLFKPFSQAPRSLARTQGGLGLGLSLVKALAELHGGSVSAHSAGPGLGTEFVVRLPSASSAGGPTPASPGRPSARPRRILVIEDNVDAAQMLAEVLELGGHSVRIAHDGPEGIAAAREMRPEIVFCDLGLPGLNGYEVARSLRADQGLSATVLVALSGYSQSEDQERSAEAGFDAHLAKPATIDELEALIAALP
jgi:PAS domain S-box-containing protein